MKGKAYTTEVYATCRVCETEDAECDILMLEGLKPTLVCKRCIRNLRNNLGIQIEYEGEE
jgi:hypothetical protein